MGGSDEQKGSVALKQVKQYLRLAQFSDVSKLLLISGYGFSICQNLSEQMSL